MLVHQLRRYAIFAVQRRARTDTGGRPKPAVPNHPAAKKLRWGIDNGRMELIVRWNEQSARSSSDVRARALAGRDPIPRCSSRRDRGKRARLRILIRKQARVSGPRADRAAPRSALRRRVARRHHASWRLLLGFESRLPDCVSVTWSSFRRGRWWRPASAPVRREPIAADRRVRDAHFTARSQATRQRK